MLALIRDYLAPIIEYRKQGEHVGEFDLRIRWDVEITIGKDTNLLCTSGTSLLPELASNDQIHFASQRLDAELIAKLVMPAVSKMQILANKRGLEYVKNLEVPPPLDAIETSPAGLPGGDETLAIEAELISQTAEPV